MAKKNGNSKSLNTLENTLSKEEMQNLENKHYCEECGRELSLDEITDVMAEHISDSLMGYCVNNHFNLGELLLALNKASMSILGGFVHDLCDKDKVDKYYEEIHEDSIKLIQVYLDKHKGKVDIAALQGTLNHCFISAATSLDKL